MAWFLLLIVMVLSGCGKEKSVIDSAELDDYVVEVVSSGGLYGEMLRIQTADESNEIEMPEMNPWKVEFCNIDEGEPELALGVYKESEYHPVMARRIFFYNMDGVALVPKYRMSRLTYPFVDFTLFDIDDDGRDEILAVEVMKDGAQRIGAYRWANFSMERVYESALLKESQRATEDARYDFYRDDGQIKFSLIEDEIRWE